MAVHPVGAGGVPVCIYRQLDILYWISKKLYHDNAVHWSKTLRADGLGYFYAQESSEI